MKKWSILLIMVCIFISLCGCSGKEKIENKAENKVEAKVEAKKDAWNVTSYEELEDIEYISELEVDSESISNASVKIYEITYKSDDCSVLSYISIPENCLKEKKVYPVIIYNRGGNRDFGTNNTDMITSMASAFNKIVFASNYRGSLRSTGKDEFGGADVNDVIKLLDLCEKFEFADSNNIYMLGMSRGGMMTYMAARRDSRIKKIAVVSGLADAFSGYNERDDMKPIMEELIGGTPTELPEEYRKRSAVYWANEINCPTLIIHSKNDIRVSFAQAEKMEVALKKANKECEFIQYEDDIHGFHQGDIDVISKWFDK